MKWRLPRIRLRTMLVIVAMLALLSWVGAKLGPWGWRLWQASVDSRETADFIASNRRIDLRLADEHQEKAREARANAAPVETLVLDAAKQDERMAAYYREMAEYHAALERIYREHSRRPWRSMQDFPKEPPQPEPMKIPGQPASSP